MNPEFAPSARHLVFVYGTLKQGFSNDHYLRGQTYLGPARTPPGYRLYHVSDYPGMVADLADTDGVAGEVWEVDGPGLRRLDALEGVNEGLYTREPVSLPLPFETQVVFTYLYARDLTGKSVITGGDWQLFRRLHRR